jgi:hypothetical protein
METRTNIRQARPVLDFIAYFLSQILRRSSLEGRRCDFTGAANITITFVLLSSF